MGQRPLQLVDPEDDDHEPAGQALHEADPVALANEPGLQSVQLALPSEAANVPTRHSVQFDAPASIIVTYDRALYGSDIPPFDCGGVVNCLVNAAWSRGLGCVINSQGIMQSPVVRTEARIPEDEVIQTCVAIGWPDERFPANAATFFPALASQEAAR